MARVVLENVTKYYPGHAQAAVRGMSLAIEDGEFVVLVGPSGCGKSTTLRMVAGLEEVSGGTIRIGDRVVNDVPAKDRDIAMVFQNYALYPHMTVYRNMAFGLELRKRALGLSHEVIRSRVAEVAAILHLEDCLERKPRTLSGGQRQRVALGRAILSDPRAFLFDEPLSNLDAKLRLETRAEIRKLHRRLQATALYVTHEQEEAMTLGERIVVMDQGIIQQCARPMEVYDRPVNRFVAGFVGTPPMNFIPGRLIAEEGASWFVFGKQRMKLPGVMGGVAGRREGEVVLGVRPEGLSPSNTEARFQGEERCFDAKLNTVEPLGDRVDLGLGLDVAERVVCRADSHQFGKLAVGGIIKVYMDLGRVHLFEPGDNGVNITLTRETSHAAA